MMGLVLYGNSDDDLCRLVDGAEKSLVYYAPGVSLKLAVAICNALTRGVQLRVMLDFTPASVKSGYWEKPALSCFAETLKQDDSLHEFLFTFPGIRLGVLHVDDISYVFAPKVYGRKHHEAWEDFPNRLQVSLPYPDEFGGRSLYTKLMEFSDLEQFASQAEDLEIDANKSEEEILSELPPGVLPCYDFLQKVELRGSNYNILEFSISLNSLDILPDYPEQAKRLKATYKLFEKANGLDFVKDDPDACQVIEQIKTFTADLDRIKNTYLNNLGAPYGHVILFRDLPKFKEAVEHWETKVMDFAPQVKKVIRALVYKRLVDIFGKLPRYQHESKKGNTPDSLKHLDIEGYIFELENRFDPKLTLSISLFTPEIWAKKDFQGSVERVFKKHFEVLLERWKEEAVLLKEKKEHEDNVKS